MDTNARSYDRLYRDFQWDIEPFYNIGVDVCDRWAAQAPDRIALISIDDQGAVSEFSYGALRDQSNQLANYLRSMNIGREARVAILLPQGAPTALAHIACYKLGAIAIPLFTLFGQEALLHRLSDSAARVVITNPAGLAKLNTLLDDLPALELIIVLDETDAAAVSTVAADLNAEAPRIARPSKDKITSERLEVINWSAALSGCPTAFSPVKTRADDPALLIYTSGTTGQPKGALHAHRVLPGHLPGVEMSHDFLPQPGDKIWTPADWAWIGGLLDVLLPALHHGVPVVAKRFSKFTGEAALELLRDHNIRNAFLPPTALKMMRAVPGDPTKWRLSMRSVASGGEPLGTQLLDWGRDVLGVTINEFYGQSECNMVVSSAASIMSARPGKMGRAVPGHDVAIIRGDGSLCDIDEQGMIAVKRPDPVMFLRYWNNEQATRDKFINDWLITGDIGVSDAQGFIQFIGRDDDVITSSGYRIGPGEIENCLLGYEDVAMAAVVGKPDPLRGEIVKAFIILKPGRLASDDLGEQIKAFVKLRLSAHEYPREIEFVETLPMTTTGKIIRRKLRDPQSN